MSQTHSVKVENEVPDNAKASSSSSPTCTIATADSATDALPSTEVKRRTAMEEPFFVADTTTPDVANEPSALAVNNNVDAAVVVGDDDDDEEVQFVSEENYRKVTACIDLSDDTTVVASTSTATATAKGTAQSLDQDAPSTSSAAAAAAASAASNPSSTTIDCPICLQSCIHPARLPCGHIFCFLCVKGVAYKNRRCAMCRREIPPEFLDHPQLVNGVDDICITKATEDGYQWYYEGRNGWWQYDDRTSQDIEESFKKNEKSCTIMVAGYVYVVDLEAMVQQRQNEPSRCRRVKRDLATIPKKGVAGLRIESNGVVATDSNFALHYYQQQARLAQEQTLLAQERRLSHLIATSDAAMRIADDIIGSSLAHADLNLLGEHVRTSSSLSTVAGGLGVGGAGAGAALFLGPNSSSPSYDDLYRFTNGLTSHWRRNSDLANDILHTMRALVVRDSSTEGSEEDDERQQVRPTDALVGEGTEPENNNIDNSDNTEHPDSRQLRF